MNKKIVLLSGGLDSTVLIHKLKNDGNDIRALYINFGYLSSLGELHSVKYTTNTLGIPLEIVNLEGLADMIAGFYPPDIIRSIELDTKEPEEPGGDDDPSYVSGFYVLTSIASFYAQLTGYSYLDIGVLKEQSENRRNIIDFIQQWSKSVSSYRGTVRKMRIYNVKQIST
ncbi:7-cyano-7-deazaguanine synthase [Bacillus sp. F19]|nr:7-cyano-7-deazaguanine synthase [Bacillus sp. F19]